MLKFKITQNVAVDTQSTKSIKKLQRERVVLDTEEGAILLYKEYLGYSTFVCIVIIPHVPIFKFFKFIYIIYIYIYIYIYR